MHQNTAIQKHTYKFFWLSRIMLLASLPGLAAFLVGGYSTAAEAHSLSQPGGNVSDPVVRAVDIAKPAVVRIITTLQGHLTVNFSPTRSVTFPQSTPAYPIQLSGSGTFISSHGDILTADHVVNPPHDKALTQFLDTQAAPDIAIYMNQNKLGNNLTPDQVVQLLISGQLASTPAYDQPQSEVFQSTDYIGPISAHAISDIDPASHATVDRIEKESAFNAKDVAIVHVPMNDMPSVQLGDSSSVQQQDELTIIGFPGNADISNSPNDLFTSSINKIIVSSMKTTDTGTQVIQVGGNVEHGDSGGPALDSQGTVVGIVSFGLVSSNSPGSTSFLQASNSAKDLVTALGLDTRPGPFEQAWNKAFHDYASTASGHWHLAHQEFQALATKYPRFKAITPYLNYASTQARSEVIRTPQTTRAESPVLNMLGYILVAAAILMLILIASFFLLMRSRRKRKNAQAAAGNLNVNVGQAARGSSPAAYAHPGSAPAPSQHREYASSESHDMSAFGGPPLQRPNPTTPTAELHPWPCGHMNRANARFCSICGEPAAQEPPIRRYEQ